VRFTESWSFSLAVLQFIEVYRIEQELHLRRQIFKAIQ